MCSASLIPEGEKGDELATDSPPDTAAPSREKPGLLVLPFLILDAPMEIISHHLVCARSQATKRSIPLERGTRGS
jgi:hypothetical protein